MFQPSCFWQVVCQRDCQDCCVQNESDTATKLPSPLQILDVLLSIRLAKWCDDRFGETPGAYIGARPKTQVCEDVSGAAIASQRAADKKGRGAVAQADIDTYYDTVSLVHVFNWCISQGCPENLVGTCVRLQLMPTIHLRVNKECCAVVKKPCQWDPHRIKSCRNPLDDTCERKPGIQKASLGKRRFLCR